MCPRVTQMSFVRFFVSLVKFQIYVHDCIYLNPFSFWSPRPPQPKLNHIQRLHLTYFNNENKVRSWATYYHAHCWYSIPISSMQNAECTNWTSFTQSAKFQAYPQFGTTITGTGTTTHPDPTISSGSTTTTDAGTTTDSPPPTSTSSYPCATSTQWEFVRATPHGKHEA